MNLPGRTIASPHEAQDGQPGFRPVDVHRLTLHSRGLRLRQEHANHEELLG
jgi:hypothetical protein